MLVIRFRTFFTLTSALLCVTFSAQSGSVDLSKLVVVGDSISAGVENFSLEQDQQIHGYASVIANLANVPLVLPLVPYPGAPNMLQLTNQNTITQVSGTLPPVPRVNPCDQPTNVSVPGVTLEQALTLLPAPPPPDGSGSPVAGWADIVLGFPNPLGTGAGICPGGPSAPLTEIQQAVALQPSAIITWLGNNDALVPALTGALNTLTPLDVFTRSYANLLDTLGQTNAPVLTATIPDVTEVSYFTSLPALAKQANMNVNKVARQLNLDQNDLLRPTAVPIALAMLHGQPGSLDDPCPAGPVLEALTPTVPCVLKASDANIIRATVVLYNVVIYAESILHRASVVDIHALVDQLSQNGYKANGQLLTTGSLGGLISLDGVHPTNTGYAIIANAFIDKMNQLWGTSIAHADVNAIAANDPLVPPIKVSSNR